MRFPSIVRVLARALVLAGVAMLGGATFVYFMQPTHSTAKPPRFSVAVKAAKPDLAWPLERLGGATTNLADFQEKVLFVRNWATWCGPCVREMPAMEKLAARFEGRSVAFIVVSSEAVDTVSSFVAERNWQLPIYVAKARPAPFQTPAIPSTFILDSARRVVFSHMGTADWDDETTDDYLHQLLAASI